MRIVNCLVALACLLQQVVAQKPHLVYSRPVVIDGLSFGDVQIFEGQEPADVAYSFINQHKLGHNVKTAILQDACNQLRCTRESAVVYRKPVGDQNNNLVGTVEIYEGQEPVDVVYKFCQQHNLGADYRNAIMDDCCQALECKRNDALIYKNTIKSEDKVYGLLEVYESQEPADAVHEFATQRGLDRNLRDVLIRNVCGALPYKCTRLTPVVYKKPVASEEGKVVGTLAILEGEEPVDVAHRFVTHHGLPVTYRNAILNDVCSTGVIPCSRTEPIVYSKPVARADGVRVGTVTIYEGQEPVDVIYPFVLQHQLDMNYKTAILRDACNQVRCERAEARIFKREIVLEERPNNEIVGGILEIYENQEPADVVYHFCQDRGVSNDRFMSVMQTVCAEIPCSRLKPIIFSLPIASPESERIGILTVLQDEEPVDAVHKFFLNHGLVKKNWDRTPIMNHVCYHVRCNRWKALAVNTTLTLEDGKEPLPSLLVWENEEPADVIYHFAKAHNLTDEIRKNILVNVCRKQMGMCNRPDPVIYSFEVSKEQPYVCNTNKAGWRFLSPNSRWYTDWAGYEKFIAPQLNNDTSTHPYMHMPIFEGFVWLGIALHVVPWLLLLALAVHRFNLARASSAQRERYYGHTVPSIILELTEELEEAQADPALDTEKDSFTDGGTTLNEKSDDSDLLEGMPAGENIDQDDALPTSKSKARRRRKRKSASQKKNPETSTKEVVNTTDSAVTDSSEEVVAENDYDDAYEPTTVPVLSVLCKTYFMAIVGGFFIMWVLMGLDGWITPDPAIDAAFWKTKLVAELEVLEGQEPVDAVYDFCTKNYLKEIMRTKLHEELVEHVCNESMVLTCNRLRSRELLGKGTLTQNGIAIDIKYQRPPNDDYCAPLDQGVGTNCTLEGAKSICNRLLPPPDDCIPMMLDFIEKELANHDRKRWKGKTDHYRALGILKDSSDMEAEKAFRKLAPQFGGIVIPYAPPDNRTEPYWWEENPKKLWKVKQAYETLCTPKEREFYDKPCEPVFGGAMCARRTSDGGMQILVEQGEE